MIGNIENIKKYVRAANYISAVQIYLQDNYLLNKPLASSHIKPRLLGHWGTCPGINFVYAHLNALSKKHNARMMFVLGPGHGFPALQANLFLEGTLSKYYPEATLDEKGIAYLARNFSWPYGFPSHASPGAPGVILEGGELGYSLSTAYGAALDRPELVVACLIGDGEAETGPLAASWHINKLINPAEDGAVLPILHLNGYKISGPTIFGRMSNKSLISLFQGYGYDPIIVEGEDVYKRMNKAVEKSYKAIRDIQDKARRGRITLPAVFPMIILKTPKGWTGIKKLHGNKIEGNFLSHQVVAPNAKSDPEELREVESWLRSYGFSELFDNKGGFEESIKSCLPSAEYRIGDSCYSMGGPKAYQPLKLPEVNIYAEDVDFPGVIGSSSMRRAGAYLKDVFELNKPNRNFRMMSPDETYSNKLDEVFKATARAFSMPIVKEDRDLSVNGRVMEMLSEHNLQGIMQGYVLTGRHAVFASYEAFIQIVASMADQYAKFLKQSHEVKWRGDIPSLNYILTSSGWRQEHNGFSHQNPGFVDDMLQKQGCLVNVYFPACGNSALLTLEKCLSSKNSINIIVAGKTLEPRWLNMELAAKELKIGLMVWDFASEKDPDIVLCGVGDYLTKECLAAIDIVKSETPEVKARFVNILSLSALGFGHDSCRVPLPDFENYFTNDKPVIFNFHGYPQTLKQILFDYEGDQNRFSVHGYEENGSTTTPFDMHIRNGTSRYDLAIEVFETMVEKKVLDRERANKAINVYKNKISEHGAYIRQYGVDPAEIQQWQWKRKNF